MTWFPRLILCSSLLGSVLGCEQHHTLTPRPDAGNECIVNKAAKFERPVDLLFVMDDSGSMREEQAALRGQMSRLIQAFSSGDLNDDGVAEHPAVADLHIGVVSTDLGLPDVEDRDGLGCGSEAARYGDDGALLTGTDPSLEECARTLPAAPFLSWAPSGDAAKDEAGLRAVVDDAACLASLGTQGCGFEQQLEASLKALWPSDNRVGDQVVNLDRAFYDDTPGQAGPAGLNAGFLRNTPGNESVIVVVMLTDENDCSSFDMSHFTPDQFLPASDPLKGVGLNLRCLHAPENLHAVSRYIDGLKALRGGREDLVVFAAVAGVPTDLIDVTVDLADAAARDDYYDTMLADERMQEVEDPETLTGNPNLKPACSRMTTDVLQKAYPARRIVEVARGFGRNGLVESICQDDFTAIADHLLERVFGALQRSSCTKD